MGRENTIGAASHGCATGYSDATRLHRKTRLELRNRLIKQEDDVRCRIIHHQENGRHTHSHDRSYKCAHRKVVWLSTSPPRHYCRKQLNWLVQEVGANCTKRRD